MSWHKGRLAAFDIETTGVDTESDRVVTAAVSVVGGGLPTESHAWLVDPGIEIPAGATAVHGVTTERARSEGTAAADAISEIVETLGQEIMDGVPIVAFNARFDLTCLDRESRRYGLESLLDQVDGSGGMLVIDPLILDKKVDQFRRGSRKLVDVCAHYKIQLDEAHDANADAIAAARVAYRIGDTKEELQGLTLRDLHDQQVLWAAEQAKSLQEYFEKQGRTEMVEGAWPVIPFPAEGGAPADV